MADISVHLADLTQEERELLLLRLGKSSTGQPKAASSVIIPSHKKRSPVSMSFAQERLWVVHQINPESSAYNISLCVTFEGSLDIGALEMALNELIQRHDSFRTSFALMEGAPVQVIAAGAKLVVPLLELHDVPKHDQHREIGRVIAQEAGSTFDLGQAPLMRARILRIGEQEHILLLTLHHMIFDGWSSLLLAREFIPLYKAFCDGEPSPLLPLTLQYSDFALWQREWFESDESQAQMGYWKQKLADLPVLQVPTDHPQRETPVYRAAQQTRRLRRELVDAMKAAGQREGVTLFMYLLAGFKLFLGRYTGETDIVIGSPVAGRNRPELEAIIGLFVNSLILRTNLGGQLTVKELLQRVRKTCIEAYTNQDLPFEKLVAELRPERDLNVNPLFQVMFTMQSVRLPAAMQDNLRITLASVPPQNAKFAISLMAEETASGLLLQFEYFQELFEAETVERMIGHYQRVLESMVQGDGRNVWEVPLLSTEEYRHVLEEWNQTEREYDTAASVVLLFEQQAEKNAGKTALVYEGHRLTYAEMNRRANQMARYLRGLGVEVETCVGICIERSLEMMVGLLGILKAGGAYVPLDPEYPKERLSYMVEDAQVPVLLTTQRTRERVGDFRAVHTVCLDEHWHEIGKESTDNFKTGACGENLIYVIYTSGSTGRPKGVAVRHRGVLNYVLWAMQAYRLGEGCGSLVSSSLSFDLTVTSIFPALLSGLEVVLLPQSTDIETLGGHLSLKENYSLLKLTPSHLHGLSALLPASTYDATRLLVIGGEALKYEDLDFWRKQRPGTRIINEYGPTETVVGSSIYKVDAADPLFGTVPIGRPIANTQIYIVDANWQPVPVGVPGEMMIGGDGVSRGYLKRPDLTAEKFVPDAFSKNQGRRLYRTGDRARWLRDGNLEFLGRIDHQIKIRGYRIEPGEIESMLRKHPSVKNAVVLSDATTGNRLVAYVATSQARSTLSPDRLREFLKEQMPDYMVPAAYVLLPELPLTPNGKLDRKALPRWQDSRPEATFALPSNPVEEILAQIWNRVLNIERIGVHDNFFALGGDSIHAIQIILQANQAGLGLSPRQLFQNQTIASLASIVNVDAGPIAKDKDADGLPFGKDTPDEAELWKIRNGAEIDDVYPLAPITEHMMKVYLHEPEAGVPVSQSGGVIWEEINVPALERAWNKVIARHPILRTACVWKDLRRPLQVVHSRVTGLFEYRDWRHFSPVEQEKKIADCLCEERNKLIRFERPGTYRMLLIRITDSYYEIVFTMNYAMLDGWSSYLIRDELQRLYAAEATGQQVEIAPATPYREYISWIKRKNLDAAREFWMKDLAGFTEPTPFIISLPKAMRRRRQYLDKLGTKCFKTVHGRGDIEQQHFYLPTQVATRLEAFAREHRMTLSTVIYGTWGLLLARYTSKGEVLFGVASSGRPPELSTVGSMIGRTLTQIPMRLMVPPDAELVPWLLDLQSKQVQLREFEYVAPNQIYEWAGCREKLLYESYIYFQNLQSLAFLARKRASKNMEIAPGDTSVYNRDEHPLRLDVFPKEEQQNMCMLVLMFYFTKYFDTATVTCMLEDFEELLTYIAGHQECRLSDLLHITDEKTS
jgi:amino acid adenylation domain-containing protein